MKWNKLMKVSAVTAMCLSVSLAGCGKKEDSSSKETKLESIEDRYKLDENTPAWKLDSKKEPTKLTWYINADWWNTEFGKDVVTKKIQEDLNVDIKFITGDDTKLNTIFAGGDMPDMITIFDSTSQTAKKAATWALPLNDLADKYDPYFYKVASEDTLNWFKLDDGKTYGYPDYSNTQKDYEDNLIKATTAFVIRKDVFNKLNMPQFNTPKEFLDNLKAIKKEFPDLIPFGFNSMNNSTGSLGDVLQDMLGVPLETKDGEFYDRNLDEDYISWLKVLNEAYREGLISDDSFADDGTAFEEKVKAGKYATMFVGGTPQLSGNFQTFAASNTSKEYIAVDAFESNVGNEPTLNQSGISGWMVNYITKACSDPAKAIQIFTYLLSEEGQLLTTYGIEDITYEQTADGKYKLLPEVQKMKEADPDRYKKEYRLGEFILFGHDRTLALSSEPTSPAIEQMQEWGEGKLYPHFILENTSPDTGTPEARSLSAINTQWNTSLVNMLRAKNDKEFDKEKDEFEKFLEQNHWDDIKDIYTEKIKENKEKLDK